MSAMGEGWELDTGQLETNAVYYNMHHSDGSGVSCEVAIRNGHGYAANGRISGISKMLLINGGSGTGIQVEGTSGMAQNEHHGDQMSSTRMVRIELPAPHRNEPKFPPEYTKTLIGNLTDLRNCCELQN